MPGVYVPPAKRQQISELEAKNAVDSRPNQKIAWEKLKTTIRGTINKVCCYFYFQSEMSWSFFMVIPDISSKICAITIYFTHFII